MIRAWLALCMCLFFSSALAAGPVPVRGGEHNGFSRLVIDLPARFKYALSDAEKIKLSIDGVKNGFDLGSWRDKLREGRISSISQIGSTQLEIELECDCSIRSFYAGRSMLVIDVLEGSQAANEPIRPKPRASAPKSSIGESGVRLPLITNARREPTSLSMPEAKPHVPEQSTENLRVELARQISRGVSQRLLRQQDNVLSGGAGFQPKVGQNEKIHDERKSLTVPVESNVRVMTAADRSIKMREAFRENRSPEMICSKSKEPDIARWINSEDFDREIGNKRKLLFNAHGEPDKKAARSLARAYLAFGLGEEAEAVLLLAGHQDQNLLAMASVLQDEAASIELPQAWRLKCSGLNELWFAAAGEVSDARDLEPSAMLGAFSALPRPLRKSLAPRLISTLLEQGRPTIAEEISRLSKRGGEEESAAQRLSDGALERHLDDPVSAQREFGLIISSNAAESPEALSAIVALEAERGNVISDEYFELLDAFLAEYREGPTGELLLDAKIRALSTAGKFADGLLSLRRFVGAFEGPNSRPLADYFLTRLTEDARNVEFLMIFFSDEIQHDWFSKTTLRKANLRLSELGFSGSMDSSQEVSEDITLEKENAGESIEIRIAKPDHDSEHRGNLREKSVNMVTELREDKHGVKRSNNPLLGHGDSPRPVSSGGAQIADPPEHALLVGRVRNSIEGSRNLRQQVKGILQAPILE